MSSMFEERHFYNRSYISVNTTTPDTFSPFPYSNYSIVPRYNSRIDDYANRFSSTKLSPGLASDDGYGSSSASSTFMSFNPRREGSGDDLISKSRNPLKSEEKSWRDIEILRKNINNDNNRQNGTFDKIPSERNDSSVTKSNNGSRVEFATNYTSTQNSPRTNSILKKPKISITTTDGDNAEIDGNPQKNVKHSIAEVEEREKFEKEKAKEALMPQIIVSPASPLPEEKIRASDGIVRLQAGTNKYDSQKGMTGFGTSRRETTKMIDTKHPEYDHERPDQSEIPLQSGTNKFASQKGMTGFGTNRRETSRIVDTAHPEYDPETSIDATSIPYQMGSNQYASQKGMTGFGQPRWEVLDPSISWQNRKSQGMVRLQSGTNRFASQQGMIGFGTIRNTTYLAESGELPYEDMKKSEAIIPSQAGWNKGDSQKRMTSFGAPRDVKGKHLKRIWELEYPEEAEVSLDRL